MENNFVRLIRYVFKQVGRKKINSPEMGFKVVVQGPGSCMWLSNTSGLLLCRSFLFCPCEVTLIPFLIICLKYKDCADLWVLLPSFLLLVTCCACFINHLDFHGHLYSKRRILISREKE